MHQYVHKKSSAAQSVSKKASLDLRERIRDFQLPPPETSPNTRSLFHRHQDSKTIAFHQRGPFSASSYSESSDGEQPAPDIHPPTSCIADPNQASPRVKAQPHSNFAAGLRSGSASVYSRKRQADNVVTKDDVFKITDDSYPNTTSGGDSEFDHDLDSRQGLNRSPTELMQIAKSNRHIKQHSHNATKAQPPDKTDPKDTESPIRSPVPGPIMTISFKGRQVSPLEPCEEQDFVNPRNETGDSRLVDLNKAYLETLTPSLRAPQPNQETKGLTHPAQTEDKNTPLLHGLSVNFERENSPIPGADPGNAKFHRSKYHGAPWRSHAFTQTQAENDVSETRDENPETLPLNHTDEQDIAASRNDETVSEHAESLDYDMDELRGLDASTLRNQPFDTDPRQGREPSSQDGTTLPLHSRLAEAASLKDAEAQQALLASLPMSEWEQAGEWFTERFAELNRKLRKSRQERRRLAKAYEEQLWTQYDAVMSEHQSIDETLAEMKKSGNAMLAQAPPKRKHGSP